MIAKMYKIIMCDHCPEFAKADSNTGACFTLKKAIVKKSNHTYFEIPADCPLENYNGK